MSMDKRTGYSGLFLAATLLVSCTLACSVSAAGQGSATDSVQTQVHSLTFEHPAEELAEAVTSLLVERGEMAAPVASNWRDLSSLALEHGRPVSLTSESVNVPDSVLKGMVQPDQAKFIGKGGGRYVLTIPITPETATRSTVEVIATFVATVPEPGPLGGRPLTSNGTLEETILQALKGVLGKP